MSGCSKSCSEYIHGGIRVEDNNQDVVAIDQVYIEVGATLGD